MTFPVMPGTAVGVPRSSGAILPRLPTTPNR
jgi:hypothetical protein